MPKVEVTVGGRSFEVACQAGEEPYLAAAAGLLDAEAQALSAQTGRMPESRMLLMAGLMLADKTSGLEERVLLAERRAAEADARAAAAESARAAAEKRPQADLDVADWVNGLADEAEELARTIGALAEPRRA